MPNGPDLSWGDFLLGDRVTVARSEGGIGRRD